MNEFFSKFRNQLLAIFDVEGVLYDAEYLPILAEKVNKEKEIWDITKRGLQGLINLSHIHISEPTRQEAI